MPATIFLVRLIDHTVSLGIGWPDIAELSSCFCRA